ncbi:MAG TPA: class I SAM-dependent methyltransferase [Thermoanaerobaculia bacterium]|jgi:SAM-dependent methyltransferase|nr:class I SAM-dependent methyltransferase [Thermoanaerobaculia bacterium]
MDQVSSGVYRLMERAGVYERFQRALGARAARRRFVAEFLRPFPGARILDIGCGTGSLLDDLPPDVDYAGYDLNPRYIAEAEQRYGSRGRFFHARVGDEPPLEEGFDLVVAKGVLHHLSDSDAGHLIRDAHSHLREGGCLVTSDPVFHSGQSRIARFLISRDRGLRVRMPEGYRALLAPCFSEIEERLVTDLLTVPYSHFILRARKT